MDISFDNGSNNCSNYVAAAGTATTLRARRMSNGGIHPFAIPENVTFVPVKDGQNLEPKADGLYLEDAGFVLIVR